jgi:5-amino-6-(D-ribitylamino)uracil---L-tyrosine 4-hydroxyphenyl transferase
MLNLSQILDRALLNQDLTPEEGLVLLQQTQPEQIEAVREVADRLRQRQVGELLPMW